MHHYHIRLVSTTSGAVVAEGDSFDLVSFFRKVPNGTYKVLVDAFDAAGNSIVQGGEQASSNTVTVASPNVTYSSGSCLLVRLKLLSATGEQVGNKLIVEDGDEWTGTPNLSDGGNCPCPTATPTPVPTPVPTPEPTPTPTPVPTATPLGCFGTTIPQSFINTIVGNGSPASSPNGTLASASAINWPGGMERDAAGNLYFSESRSNRIRMIPAASGTYFGVAMQANRIYTVAGNGFAAFAGDGGSALNASLSFPHSLALDSQGNLWIADTSNFRVRMVPKASGTYFGIPMVANSIYTVGGNLGGVGGEMGGPSDMAFDSSGNLIIANRGTNAVLMIPTASGTYFGKPMVMNTPNTLISGLSRPHGLAFDADGNLLVAEWIGARLLMLPKNPGTYYGHTVAANALTTLAGNGVGVFSGDGGPASASQVYPTGVRVDANRNVFVADYQNNRVRMIPTANGTYYGQQMTANNIYSIAGSGPSTTQGAGTSTGDGGLATAATINGVADIALDTDGNIFLTDTWSHRIRMVANGSCTP